MSDGACKKPPRRALSTGNEQGGGILTVMIAAVVLGVVAVNFAQKMTGKATVSRTVEIMAFQDIMLEYYSSVAANRAAYDCTVDNNSAPPSGSSFSAFKLYDIGKTVTTCTDIVIPTAGRDMKIGDDIASNSTIPCAKNNGSYLCVKAEWREQSGVVEIKISVEFDKEDTASGITMPLRTREKSVFFGKSKGGRMTVGTNCAITKKGALTQTKVGVFKGDRPIVSIKSHPKNELECGKWPLVIPLHFDTYKYKTAKVGAICPDLSGGKTGLRIIDAGTGVTTCNTDYILFKSDTGDPCGNNQRRAILKLDKAGIAKKCSHLESPKRGGVQPVKTCGLQQGITGWNTTNDRRSPACRDIAKGPKGTKGRNLCLVKHKYHVCAHNNQKSCTSNSDCDRTGTCRVSTYSGDCSNDSWTSCHSNSHCSFGSCNTSTNRCSGNSSVSCTRFGGQCSGTCSGIDYYCSIDSSTCYNPGGSCTVSGSCSGSRDCSVNECYYWSS